MVVPPVFPTQVGMFLVYFFLDQPKHRLPRASGDVSLSIKYHWAVPLSSPRKRGCFWRRARVSVYCRVFPAQAGMFLCFEALVFLQPRIPRASGDVSKVD